MSVLNTVLGGFSQTTACSADSGFLWFPNWYRGLQCDNGQVVFQSLNDAWVITANIVDMAIQAAGLLAVIVIIYGGIRYITSQGEPEGIQSAKKIITNSVLGLVIAILASTLVGFIAGQF